MFGISHWVGILHISINFFIQKSLFLLNDCNFLILLLHRPFLAPRVSKSIKKPLNDLIGDNNPLDDVILHEKSLKLLFYTFLRNVF